MDGRSFIWEGPGSRTELPFNEAALAEAERVGLLQRGDCFDVVGLWFKGYHGTFVERKYHQYHVRIKRQSHEVVAILEVEPETMINADHACHLAQRLTGQEWLAAYRQRQAKRKFS